eukprot:m.152394 g.152394  ORF g.152394 m.152394 type:complete len:164 (+) comp10161_c0_seq5:30-521(+)
MATASQPGLPSQVARQDLNKASSLGGLMTRKAPKSKSGTPVRRKLPRIPNQGIPSTECEVLDVEHPLLDTDLGLSWDTGSGSAKMIHPQLGRVRASDDGMARRRSSLLSDLGIQDEDLATLQRQCSSARHASFGENVLEDLEFDAGEDIPRIVEYFWDTADVG